MFVYFKEKELAMISKVTHDTEDWQEPNKTTNNRTE